MKPLVPALLLFVTAPALASTALQMDLSSLTAQATDVVRGRVISSTPSWTGDHRRIVTRVEVEVLEAWKGSATGRLTVVQPGGELDGIGQRVTGVAQLGPGEELVLFLERTGQHHRVVGLAQGVYRVSSAAGVRQAVPASLEGLELITPAGPAPAARQAMPLARLREAVQEAR
ncbi:MAG TPA: hypothetical protein VFE93_02035 [Myxococcaceae bacterium]|jgi:hypothetical protein|nr:hypothetical protein [Myxococcaceae bacterium]